MSRTVVLVKPDRIGYVLTKKGRALGEAFKTISTEGGFARSPSVLPSQYPDP